MPDELVHLEILLSRLPPRVVVAHAGAGKSAERVAAVSPQLEGAVEGRFDTLEIGVLEDIAVALGLRNLRPVAVEDRVAQTTDGSHHRDRAVAHGDHLRQS